MFNLNSEFKPLGDQPQAIEKLTESFQKGNKENLLLGVTGSGKTFTMANLIKNLGLPTLIISHNKTLAAQLYDEFRFFFPDDSVEYFVSFYDYYQPEAYIPSSDTYIEKDSDINEEIDRMRLSATSSLLSNPNNTIIVSSVSCIYGLGSPEDYENEVIHLKINNIYERTELLKRLISMQYKRNQLSQERGTFRVLGDTIEIYLAYRKRCIRLSFWDDTLEKIEHIDSITESKKISVKEEFIFPARHFMTTKDKLQKAVDNIQKELELQVDFFRNQGKYLEAQRIQQRTEYDIEMLQEMNYCNGIENYSRHLAGKKPGETPYTLFDYFPENFLCIIDESHATIPQIRGMFNGDYARKKNLVDFGFRLPSALDNRPLKFDEFVLKTDNVLYVSATPADYETERSFAVVEQIIRPTGLIDPEIIVKPTLNQVDDVVEQVNRIVERKERVLITTLTIKMAEQLADYLKKLDIKVQYIHSKIDTLERVKILHSLRKGEYDVLVGINLLREGLDLPEVSLVAILDADKEGFLRSKRSLIQISGRAARNVNGTVIMYADNITDSMRFAIDETNRRRTIQQKYNTDNNITPESVKRKISDDSKLLYQKNKETFAKYTEQEFSAEYITELYQQMIDASNNLEFEKAAELRDLIQELEK